MSLVFHTDILTYFAEVNTKYYHHCRNYTCFTSFEHLTSKFVNELNVRFMGCKQPRLLDIQIGPCLYTRMLRRPLRGRLINPSFLHLNNFPENV